MLTPELRGGIYLPACGLWLDPPRPKPFAVVSHAHSDHTARHESFLATPATIDLIRVRMGNAVAQRGIPLPFGEQYQHGSLSISLHPAGHVLGSAMVRIEASSGESLLYTGDFKMNQGLAAEGIEVPHADGLVMETTFGKPSYAFPKPEETHQRIRQFCADALSEGAVPVLLAYSLGKAQEVLMVLRDAGWPLMVHKTVRELNQVYLAHGIALPETRPMDFLNMGGCVLVMPPSVQKKLPEGNYRTAMVSGWGLDSSARYRYGVDEVIPLSDHADYGGLMDFVKIVEPKTVYTVHGYAKEFATDLRREGYDAWSLAGGDQLELI